MNYTDQITKKRNNEIEGKYVLCIDGSFRLCRIYLSKLVFIEVHYTKSVITAKLSTRDIITSAEVIYYCGHQVMVSRPKRS